MSEGVRETICSKCIHVEVCEHKIKYLDMLGHLQEEFELFMQKENRKFMSFQDPMCAYLHRKPEIAPRIPLTNSDFSGNKILSAEEIKRPRKFTYGLNKDEQHNCCWGSKED